MKCSVKKFGKLKNGEMTHLYSMEYPNGAKLEVLDYGGCIRRMIVPDKNGDPVDVVLGYETITDYENGGSYFGALIGRVGNRIAGGRFHLNGKEYHVAANHAGNHLHGGLAGFDRKIWNTEWIEDGLKLTYISEDGEENYPGTLTVTVQYHWSETPELKIVYNAVSDQDTLCNLTNHSYFNLSGHGSGSMLDQELTLQADAILETDDRLIPTGNYYKVKGTPFDFRSAHQIGERIGAEDLQLKNGNGYDHNFILDRKGAAGGEVVLAAMLYSSHTGIRMSCLTDQPGIQIYSGNGLCQIDPPAKDGALYHDRQAVAMETQGFPDAVNHPDFPSVVLKAGETYHTETIYRFSADEMA